MCSSNVLQFRIGKNSLREITPPAATRLWRRRGMKYNNFSSFVLFSMASNVLFDFKVRDSSPPMQVLTRCQDLCLRDRTAANNLVRTCSSFDFQPGKRLTLPTSLSAPFTSTSPTGTGNVEYDESVCFLSRELPRPEGLGTLVNLPGHFLYSEVCLSCKFHISYYILDYTFIRTDFPSLKHAIN